MGRLRHLGVLLYDADAVLAAASTKDERELYPAHLLAALDRFLDEHTDGETAVLLNAARHTSGARGLLTIAELARHLDVHPTTIKNWHQAGLLVSHKATDKNERLFEAPAPGDPRLVARQGSPLRNRKPSQPMQRGAV